MRAALGQLARAARCDAVRKQAECQVSFGNEAGSRVLGDGGRETIVVTIAEPRERRRGNSRRTISLGVLVRHSSGRTTPVLKQS